MTGALLVIAAQITLAPCTVERVVGEARCGTYEVWENRAAKIGRKIPLNIVVLPALGEPRQPDPLFPLQGGPGQGVTGNAGFYNRLYADVRKTRDLVLVDLRGTGKSAGLTCPELGRPGSGGVFDADLLPPGAVKTCRERLERQADLRFYTTDIAVDDLDEVREALGYPQVNLYGTSYGTRVALVWMRRHPSRVRAVAMKGVVPTSMAMPDRHAQNGEAAWQRLVDRCDKDPTCRAAFPTPAADLQSILERLERSPAAVDVKQADGSVARVVITRGLFGEAFRSLLYSPEALARTPSTVHRIARGDEQTLGSMVLATRRLLASDDISAGFFLSVTCAEDIPFLPRQRLTALTANTFGGDYRLRQQMQACDLWPRGEVPNEHRLPVRSDIAVLMFSGEFDPVTPPAGAEEVLQTLPRGTHVVVKNNGHAFGNLDACGGPLVARFLDAKSANGLDTSCAQSLPAVPWILK